MAAKDVIQWGVMATAITVMSQVFVTHTKAADTYAPKVETEKRLEQLEAQHNELSRQIAAYIIAQEKTYAKLSRNLYRMCLRDARSNFQREQCEKDV